MDAKPSETTIWLWRICTFKNLSVSPPFSHRPCMARLFDSIVSLGRRKSCRLSSTPTYFASPNKTPAKCLFVHYVKRGRSGEYLTSETFAWKPEIPHLASHPLPRKGKGCATAQGWHQATPCPGRAPHSKRSTNVYPAQFKHIMSARPIYMIYIRAWAVSAWGSDSMLPV